MDDSVFMLRTGETWKRHPTVANLYSEQLSYAVFGSVPGNDVRLPENFVEALLEPSCIRGFSLVTGRLKIISSDEPVIFASGEE